MKDALGSVQSVLVLGGGSDIAQATLRELVQRRARTIVLAARDPGALERSADELRDCGRDDGRDRRLRRARHRQSTHAFVDGVFERIGDVDLAILAFGVLGDQEEAEHDGRAAVDIAEVNYVGAVSVAVPDRAADAHAGARHDRRAVVGGRASGPGAPTSSTARRRRAWTRSSRAWATASSAPG